MIEQSLAIPGFLDTTAIMAGALTGAMHATRKGLDVMGVLFVAFVGWAFRPGSKDISADAANMIFKDDDNG